MKLAELQEHMKRHSLGYCLFFNLDHDPNFFYFTQNHARGVLVVSQTGCRQVISSLDHSSDMRRRCKTLVWSKGKLLDLVSGLLPDAKRIGVDKNALTVKMLQSIRQKVRRVSFQTISETCAELRSTKTDLEIARIQKACSITESIFEECRAKFSRFRTEFDVATFLRIRCLEHGCDVAFDPVVASGGFASVPHHVPRKTPLKNGFCVIDFGVRYEGYCSDLTRTFYLGSPRQKDRELFRKVKDCQQRLFSMMHPGAAADEIHALAAKLLGRHLTHAAGHGVGLEVHEAPVLGSESSQKIQEAMVISVEPGMYAPRSFGIRIEDMVVVTKASMRLLSRPQEFIKA